MDREKELALANIDKAEALIKKGIGSDIEAFVKVVNMLVIDCEKVGKIEKGKYYARKLIEYVSENKEKTSHIEQISGILLSCYDMLARHGDFEAFMIAMEWNRPIERQFYLPRRRVLKHHGFIQGIQDLLDRKIQMLILEAPPGIGKSVMGEFAFAYQYVLNPERKSLMSGHSNMLAIGFYQDILDFFTSPEYRFREIFKDFPEIIPNSEYKMLYTERKKREPNMMFSSIEVGGTGIIHVDGMLYVDDLIKTPEQANNPEQCLKIRNAYTGTLQDRLVNETVPILVIGTMWSINDHINYLKQKYEGEPWFRCIAVPCMNEERTESNFMYDFGLAKTVEHWDRLIKDDDEVIANAKYFCIAMDREGKLFNIEELHYFTDLPLGEPDYICSAVDVAFGGGDDYSMPIAYVYGDEVYIKDVIYSPLSVSFTRPYTLQKIIEHNISRVHFEANNGGEEYAENISEDCKNAGVVCNITSSRVPTNRSKLDRILSVAPQIKSTDLNNNTYKIYFLSRAMQNSEYKRFMECFRKFSQDLNMQGKQHDDAVDSVANLINNVLGKTRYASVSSSMSRASLGF